MLAEWQVHHPPRDDPRGWYGPARRGLADVAQVQFALARHAGERAGVQDLGTSMCHDLNSASKAAVLKV
ncbi:hypothetical protein GCM10010349_18220 [Streptomyces flavofungini]|nr:hypothetical protein GCM10010349_18220 [Streptomyces flavofungini]